MKKEQEITCCRRKTSIGGQALIEGIMMRGPQKSALAVRNPKGEIVVEEFKTKGANRPGICKLPIIRGIFGYIDSMAVGYKSLMRSAEIAGLDEVVEEKPKKQKKNKKTSETSEAESQTPEVSAEETEQAEASESEKPAPEAEPEQTETGKKDEKDKKDASTEKLPAWVWTVVSVFSVILGVALACALFVWAPAALFGLLKKNVDFLSSGNAALDSLYKSVFEGIIKIIILVAYMGLMSFEKDIRRTFMFHGAEHKTIFCYEAGLELTVENIRKQKRFHPRCGTSFLILMVLVSIFISFFIDPISVAATGEVLPTGLRVTVKLLLIPLIVGLGYELIKFAGRHDNWFTRMISAPGMWLQHITVFEPTDGMIECAIAAVREVIPEDGSDQW